MSLLKNPLLLCEKVTARIRTCRHHRSLRTTRPWETRTPYGFGSHSHRNSRVESGFPGIKRAFQQRYRTLPMPSLPCRCHITAIQTSVLCSPRFPTCVDKENTPTERLAAPSSLALLSTLVFWFW